MHRFHVRRLNHGGSAVILLLLVVLASGCKEEMKGGPRVDVVPITGKLLIDGQPQEGIFISFTRTSDRGVDFAVPNPEGITDKDGKISATTYLIGDGCPPGDYTLTFQWATMNPISGTAGGDKFKGKFMDKGKSKHKVTIPKQEEPFDIGTIEISTK